MLVAPMAAFPFHEHHWIRTVGYAMLYLGYGAILVAFLYCPADSRIVALCLRSPPARVLAFIGFYSYSIYLWHIELGHLPIEKLMGHAALSAWPPEFQWAAPTALYLVTAVVAGLVAGKLIEQPALALRDYLFPASRNPSTPLSVSLAPTAVSVEQG